MPMPTPTGHSPLFTDYLMHFCGQNKTARQAQAVMESILRRGVFLPARCPLFWDPDCALERRGLQSWARMVCFTDLRFQDLHAHVRKFGPYGVALKKESGPARQCSPVHYVPVGSDAQRYSRVLAEGIEHLLRLKRERKVDPGWDFPEKLSEFDRRRIALLQDIRTRDENEWRFIGLSKGDALRFAAGDVRFLLVDTWAQALRWNDRLNDRRDPALRAYGEAGVMAIPVELLLGGRPEPAVGRRRGGEGTSG